MRTVGAAAGGTVPVPVPSVAASESASVSAPGPGPGSGGVGVRVPASQKEVVISDRSGGNDAGRAHKATGQDQDQD